MTRAIYTLPALGLIRMNKKQLLDFDFCLTELIEAEKKYLNKFQAQTVTVVFNEIQQSILDYPSRVFGYVTNIALRFILHYLFWLTLSSRGR